MVSNRKDIINLVPREDVYNLMPMGEPVSPKHLRYRLNVARTSKGYSVEATVEGVGFSKEELFAEMEEVMKGLNERYPQETAA